MLGVPHQPPHRTLAAYTRFGERSRAMTDDKLKLWLGFSKFLLGTVAVGLVSIWINSGIETRQMELKEMEETGRFVDYALQENVGVRMRFAQYFSTVIRSDELRERWGEYSELVEKEFLATQQQEAELAEVIKRGDIAAAELEVAKGDLARLRWELEVSPGSRRSGFL